MSHPEHTEHHIVSYGTQIKVWLALLALTAVTVLLAGNTHLAAVSGLVAFLIASVKASLVLAVFMHLKYEGKMFLLMGLVAVVTLGIIFALTFTDYLHRV